MHDLSQPPPEPQAHPRATAMRAIEARYLLGVDQVTEVWLARHGDCYEGMQVAGDGADTMEPDPPLSLPGRRQAERLAERLQRTGFSAVYASPLRRAQETARAIAPEVRVDERLVEVATAVQDTRLAVEEPLEDVAERMRAAVTDAAAAHPGGRIVLVGHGVAILAYLCDVMRLAPGSLRLFPFYTCVSVVRVHEERHVVGSIADTSHLE
ncbi:MAG: histidine phosphatase family protein [bacterium]|nr:histidine phosphatase family protein [bacterium]